MFRASFRKKRYLQAALIGFAIWAGKFIYHVLHSTSSTAGIGFLFVPVVGVFGAAIALALMFLLYSLSDLFRGKQSFKSPRTLASILLVLVGGFGAYAWQSSSTALAVAKNPASSSAQLLKLHSHLPFFRRDQIRLALAANPSTPPAILEKFVLDQDTSLLNAVGGNPSLAPQWVELIVAGPLSYDRVSGVASHPKLSNSAIERLLSVKREDFKGDAEYRLYQTYVLGTLARREDLAPPYVTWLANWPDPEYFLVVALAYAPNSTCGQLEHFLTSENEVLRSTVQSQMQKRHCR